MQIATQSLATQTKIFFQVICNEQTAFALSQKGLLMSGLYVSFRKKLEKSEQTQNII